MKVAPDVARHGPTYAPQKFAEGPRKHSDSFQFSKTKKMHHIAIDSKHNYRTNQAH